MVDRLWPRGLSKEKTKIDRWLKEIAPTDALRKWFSHKEERWEEFKKRYIKELIENKDILKELKGISENKTVTLLYAAKDADKNNAKVLLGVLKKR